MQFRAYLFGIQGTLLDFFSPVSTAVGFYFNANEITDIDAASFTRRWRENYFQRLQSIPQSFDKWRSVQAEYQAGFVEVCMHYGLAAPDNAAVEAVAKSWQQLVPWPDVRSGIASVRKNAITTTLSNTDMSTAIALFKRLGIGMDAIFTAEIFGAFKPDPLVYRRALAYLGVRPEDAAMVASHPYDLEAAASLGLGTIFVSRPHEYGDPALAHEMAAESVTQYVRTIGEIA